MINRIYIHVCRDINLRVNASAAFIVRKENAVAISSLRRMKFFLVTKINVATNGKEKLLSQITYKSKYFFFGGIIQGRCKMERKIGLGCGI